ncbi:MAG: Thioredoxin, partial [uncultured Rubrobacteraceae bacterium]
GGFRGYGRLFRERRPAVREAGHSRFLGAVVRALQEDLPDTRGDERGARGRAVREAERGRQPADGDELQHLQHTYHRPLRGRGGQGAGRGRPAQAPALGPARPL